ncbi:hypothetical protein BN85411610 [Alteracholeplasma palmae J233]|uniref:Uncharacterized protein n=1 Tax=Alteracholeplasma palmae (strain ATCC 49389 / J233) TaxID=1318466 RepID=U4KLK4_ALTPJ|nr:hypothetical protein [Alteracholeplasma palmae]CCV64738.1 hypothetical protein BN85411610 [Alteracholeplasma palmae J233]
MTTLKQIIEAEKESDKMLKEAYDRKVDETKKLKEYIELSNKQALATINNEKKHIEDEKQKALLNLEKIHKFKMDQVKEIIDASTQDKHQEIFFELIEGILKS